MSILQGFFTYLYGMSILFLLYVFCFLLQESTCCQGSEPKPPKPKKENKKEKENQKNKKKEKKDKKEKKEKEKEKEATPAAPPPPPPAPQGQRNSRSNIFQVNLNLSSLFLYSVNIHNYCSLFKTINFQLTTKFYKNKSIYGVY